MRCPSQNQENSNIQEFGIGKEDEIEKNPKDMDTNEEEIDRVQKTSRTTRTVTSTLASTTSKNRVGRWTDWTWNECNASCNGVQRGTRTCIPPGAHCRGPGTKKRICNVERKCRLK